MYNNCSLNLQIVLYDTYGDGWRGNTISIINSNHQTIKKNISLSNGYGPEQISFPISVLEKYILINYNSKNMHSYENYYHVFIDGKLVFKTKEHENPPEIARIPIGHEEGYSTITDICS